MENRRELQKYFKNKYYNQKNNYKAIMSEIKKEESTNKNSLFKIIISTIITLLGTTSIVFASVQIYNEYIKKQDKINSDDLYITGEGLYSNDFAGNMNYDSSVDLYYKIITNEEEFSEYKAKVNELPDTSTIDFNNNFLILIGNVIPRYLHEADLIISEINTNETTLYVTLKQKEKPDYEKRTITLYAIVDKSLLRNNIKLNLEETNTKIGDLDSIENLSANYSIEEALNDGCFVEENGKILSENKHAIDELIENAQNDVKSFLRIYSKSKYQVRIIDLQFDNGIFLAKSRKLEDTQIYTQSFKYLTKHYHPNENTYIYGYNNSDPSFESTILLIISADELI